MTLHESRFEKIFGGEKMYDEKLLARRWALNCAVAFFARTEAASSEAVIEVAAVFEKYLRGEDNG